jgi:hypothetical protein
MSKLHRLSLPPRSLAIGEGHELAIEMLEELLGEDGRGDAGDQALLDPKYRHGQPYRDIVGEYLERTRAKGPEVLRGFTMIVSDLAAAVMQGASPGAYYYDKLMRCGVIADGPQHAARRAKSRQLRALRQAR